MSRLPNTLSFRLTLTYGMSFVTFLGLAFLGLYFSIATIMDKQMDEDLKQDVNEFRFLLRNEGIDVLKHKIENEIQGKDTNQEFIKLVNSRGYDIVTSDLSAWKNLTTNTRIVLQVISSFEPIIQTVSIMIHENGVDDEDEVKVIYGHIGPDLVMQIGESLEQKEDILEILLTALIIIFCLVVPFSSLVGWVIVKKAVE